MDGYNINAPSSDEDLRKREGFRRRQFIGCGLQQLVHRLEKAWFGYIYFFLLSNTDILPKILLLCKMTEYTKSPCLANEEDEKIMILGSGYKGNNI